MRTRCQRGRAILTSGRIVVRDIPEHLVADVDVSNSETTSEENCYLILIDYLSGRNGSDRPVALRAPVQQSADDEWEVVLHAEPKDGPTQSTVRFDLPEGLSLRHLPEPIDPRLHLRTVAATRSASIWFVGGPSIDRIERHSAQLRDFVALTGLVPVAPCIWPVVRSSRRGPFNMVTELSMVVSGWPSISPLPVRRPIRVRSDHAHAHVIRTR